MRKLGMFTKMHRYCAFSPPGVHWCADQPGPGERGLAVQQAAGYGMQCECAHDEHGAVEAVVLEQQAHEVRHQDLAQSRAREREADGHAAPRREVRADVEEGGRRQQPDAEPCG